MALNQYYKNFILWGEVDFHCLICEESFQELAELDRHIRWENHRKVLKAQVKSHKFKKEVIYQVRIIATEYDCLVLCSRYQMTGWCFARLLDFFRCTTCTHP